RVQPRVAETDEALARGTLLAEPGIAGLAPGGDLVGGDRDEPELPLRQAVLEHERPDAEPARDGDRHPAQPMLVRRAHEPARPQLPEPGADRGPLDGQPRRRPQDDAAQPWPRRWPDVGTPERERWRACGDRGCSGAGRLRSSPEESLLL